MSCYSWFMFRGQIISFVLIQDEKKWNWKHGLLPYWVANKDLQGFARTATLYVTWSREMSRMSKIFYFEFSTSLSINLKMLHFDTNPIAIGYLVAELWTFYQDWKQYKTKEFELVPSQYLKINNSEFQLIFLDHITYSFGFVMIGKIALHSPIVNN